MPTPTRWAVVLGAAAIAGARYGGFAAAFSAAPGRIAPPAATLPAGAASRHLELPRPPPQGPSDAATGWQPSAAAAVALAAFALVGPATRSVATRRSKQGSGAQCVLAHGLELPSLVAPNGATAADWTARGSRIVAGLKPRREIKGQGSIWDMKTRRYKPAEFRTRQGDPRDSSPAPGNDQRTINSLRWHYNDKKYGINMYHLHRTNFQNQDRRSKNDFSMLRRWTKWLRYTQHLPGRMKNVHKHAREECSRLLRRRVRDRRLKKRNMRWIWIKRIKNNCWHHGLRYNEFISEVKAKRIGLNRKMLQQIAIYDRGVFTNITDIAIPDWKERKEFWSKAKVGQYGPPKLPPADIEEEHKKNENLVIDYIEQMLPRMYTDDTIRFNRKAYSWGTQFTVDCGDKEYWQEVLPRYPELANFQVADYWTQRPNEQNPILKADLLPDVAKFDAPQWPQDPRETPVKGSLPIQEDEEVKDEKPGISRESWFDDEPQSWFE